MKTIYYFKTRAVIKGAIEKSSRFLTDYHPGNVIANKRAPFVANVILFLETNGFEQMNDYFFAKII